uniref:Uncharacterized protein n=1 Tax=Solanum tuberosum TaxID=4113 RepID=M1DQZ9_SOLTU
MGTLGEPPSSLSDFVHLADQLNVSRSFDDISKVRPFTRRTTKCLVSSPTVTGSAAHVRIPIDGFHRDRRHGRRCATNFLQTTKFYRIQADSALSQTAERIVFADFVGDPPTGLVACLRILFQSPPLL